MTITLYAQPYDISAHGFFFDSPEDYRRKAAAARTVHGDPVEEFEIQFIDGATIDAELAKAVGLNQANLARFFEGVEAWDDHDKRVVILATGACGYDITEQTAPGDFEIDIYELDSLRELAAQFVEDGLFGDIAEPLRFYIDLDAIARDLAADYAEAEIAGTRLIYRAA